MDLVTIFFILGAAALFFYIKKQESEVRKDINESLKRFQENCTCQGVDKSL